MRVVRFIGLSYLLVAALCALLILANWHIAAIGGRNIRPLAAPGAAFFLVGVGLLYRRRSAALIAVLGSITFAAWLLLGSVRDVPIPGLFLNAVFAGIVLVPACAILIKWRDLAGW
jgi:hypothetical protein